MAITRCGHTELLVALVAKECGLDEEDVEAALLNDAAHEFFRGMGLSPTADHRAVAEAVRAASRPNIIAERVRNGK